MVTIDRTRLPFRMNTEGYFLDKDGNVLAQISDKSYVVFPGGGIDEGEMPEESIIRETLEETGAIVVKPLKLVSKLQIVWGPNWAKTDKQKLRYNKFKGDEMYFFCGTIHHFEENSKTLEDTWKGEKLMSLNEAISFLEKGKPFSEDVKKYRETQLIILEKLKKKFQKGKSG